MKNQACFTAATILALLHCALTWTWTPVPAPTARRGLLQCCWATQNAANRCQSANLVDHQRAKTLPRRSTSSALKSSLNESQTSLPGSAPAHRIVARTLAPTLAAMFLVWSLSASIASAGLLEDFGSDPSKIVDTGASRVSTNTPVSSKKGDQAIDPTLRASYYYPTAKKRYLPRIQKVTQEIAGLSDALAAGDWLTPVKNLATTADNAILPLQLYVSSLDGQGLSMKNQYAVQMKRDAAEFEKSYHDLELAIRQQDRDRALDAISGMGVAIADYRQQGRLSDDDGYIPSIDEMKRMTMRNPTVKVNFPSK